MGSFDGTVPVPLGGEGPLFELGEGLDADDVANALASCPEDDLAKELLGRAPAPTALSQVSTVEGEEDEVELPVEEDDQEGGQYIGENGQEEKQDSVGDVVMVESGDNDDGDEEFSQDDGDYDAGHDEHGSHDWEPATKARRRQ